jgi:hypothetical protein
MAIAWEEVTKKPEYQELSFGEREKAKVQYFNQVVRPRVPEVDMGSARNQFIAHTRKFDIQENEPSFIRDVVGKTILETPSRIAGVALGAVNSPLAFIWGSQRAQYDDPKEWEKLPSWKKQLVSTGAGFESAWRSTFKKGDWGTLYGEYYKAARGGKTIEDDLPNKLKWAAPTIEFMANLVSDPIIVFGEASRLARLKVPKEWVGKLPEAVVSDLNNIEKLEGIEKTQLQQKLLEALKNRRDYMNWWEDAARKIEHEIPGYKAGPEVLGKGFSETPAVVTTEAERLSGRLAENIGRSGTAEDAGRGLMAAVPDTTKAIPAKSAEESARVFARAIEEGGGTIGLKRLGDKLRAEGAEAQLHARPKQGLAEGTIIEPVVIERKPFLEEATQRLGGRVREPGIESAVAVQKDETVREFGQKLGAERGGREPKFKLAPEEAAQAVVETKSPLGKRIVDEVKQPVDVAVAARQRGKTKIAEIAEGKARKNAESVKLADGPEVEKLVDEQLGRLPVKPTTLRSVGGLALGIEEDEQGNLQYDVGKGLAGAVGLGVVGAKAGTLKDKLMSVGRKKKFTQTLTKNPAWSKVHGMIGERPRSFSVPGLWAKFDTAFLDRFAPLKKVSTKTYDEAMAFSAHKDAAKVKFDELKNTLKPVRKNEALFSDYVDAHRAYTRAKRGLKNPNGVTLQDAKQAITEIERHYKESGQDIAKLKEAFAGFQTWANKYILQEARDSGIISKERYNSILKNNEFYATFEVLDYLPPDIHKIPSLPSKEYFSVANQKVIQMMVGTERKIANPIEATVKKFTQAQTTFARNRVANIFVDDPVTQKLLRPIATNKKEFAILKNKGQNPIMQGQWLEKDFDTIARFKDGRVEKYLAPKELVDTMKQLTPKQAPRVVQALNSLFRQTATTVYLPFTISNAMRDGLMAYTTAPVYKSKDLPKFAKDWAKGFWEGAKHEFLGKSKLTEEYIKHGGGFGYVGNLRQTNLAKMGLFKKGMVQNVKDIVTSPFKLIEKVSATVELAPRLGTFKRAKMVGLPSKDAALMAKASTINFNKGGTFTKVANQWVPFLNARVQGRLTVASALKRDPKGVLSKAFVSTVVPGVATYAWNRLYYSDYYDDIPEYIKQNYFCIITGTDEDDKGRTVPKYLVISKGDLGQMAFNPIEYMMDKMWKKDQEGTAGFLVNYLSDLSPVEFAREGEVSLSKAGGSLLPPIIKGAFEDWANLNFYRGSEIVPHYTEKSKPPELQYHENTPETYKWLGKQLGISPLRLQNFAGNVLAGYGREGLDPSAMMRGLTGRLIKTRGGAKENRAWIVIKDIEQGYLYTRAYADEMIKNGDKKGAIGLIAEWNKGLDERIEKIEQFGFKDKGGLKQSYRFTPQKKKNILLRKPDKKTAIEKRLSKRR